MDELRYAIEILKRRKVKINTHSLFYDSGLILYLIHKTTNFAEVEWLLNELISLGFKISKRIFCLILYVVEDYTDVIYMLGLREKYNISLGSNEYANLLAATNNLIEAQNVLDHMKKENVEFSLLNYGLLIEKSSSYYEAKTFFYDIKRKNIDLNTNIYHQLLAKMDSNNFDEEIVKEMLNLGFNYDEETYQLYKVKSSFRTNSSFRQGLSEKFRDILLPDILKKLEIETFDDVDITSPAKIQKNPFQSSSDDSRKNWTEEEVNCIVSDYFDMLVKEMNGQTYSKTMHRRILKMKLKNRSDGSIELKHQNISGVLLDNDLPYIVGYKPRFNAQDLLKHVVLERFKVEILDTYQDREVEVNKNESSSLIGRSFNELIEQAPETSPARRNSRRNVSPGKPDFAEKERNNKCLGNAGENFVVNLERRKLVGIGRADLAVTWVSKDKGDGLGYDVLSFDKNGNQILIEVKTTNGGKSVPFYISDNELDVLCNNLSCYLIYRVFNFRRDPKVFILTAQDFLELLRKPQNFVIYPTKSNA
ncbi:DUF3883 domain-containing protein [Desulfosporosinus hippei]|uniref:Protein NO VEIN C-terminal domain-containing protein n=1 Tax=Desulfosporosinus hippei DSM 8344 TaxID=1121419 RepID=A0A1G8FMX6_9FIRM|nr:DUF3883 domain-containing protein [Desulfosporosinus hippei]SDH83346.1 protein of unknown function [Desulfosporosinus hippei DSM 8344]